MRRARTAATHGCAAPGCNERVGKAMLMCRTHWFRLPVALRDAVTSAWKAERMGDWATACVQARAWIRDHPERPRPPALSHLELSHPENARS